MDQLRTKLPESVFEALTAANFKSLPEILKCTNLELSQLTKLDLTQVESVIDHSSRIILNGKIRTANCIPKWRRISTGCPAIDRITRGGIPLHRITEIVGNSGVGKTQFCLQMSLMAQLPENQGGVGKSVVYICTEDVFPSKRLHQLANAFSTKYEGHNFEDNIFIEHVGDIERLKICIFVNLPRLLSIKPIGLVIIDSVAGPYRDYSDYSKRSQDFVEIVSTLNKLSDEYNFAIVCVNQVRYNSNTESVEPCLGLAWANSIVCRHCLTRVSSEGMREFKVVLSPQLPPSSCKFMITEDGLSEVKD